jgi:hypothetical protein
VITITTIIIKTGRRRPRGPRHAATCDVCHGSGRIPDPRQAAWDKIEYGTRYIPCPYCPRR